MLFKTAQLLQNKRSLLLLIIFLLKSLAEAQVYDPHQKKGDSPLLSTKCNSSTIIYFEFNPTSILTCGSSAECSVSLAASSSITHLDVLGKYKQYRLAEAQAVKQSFLAGFPLAFVFKFVDDSKANFIYLALPFTSNPPNSDFIMQTIPLSMTKDPELTNLKQFSQNPSATLTSGVALSTFNFLNTPDFNEFYEVMDKSKTRILLVSKPLFKISQDLNKVATTSIFPATFQPDYQATADVLCWGSFTQGQVNLPMSRNAPLWFFLCISLAAWLFVLIGQDSTPEIFDIKFSNNKWTCWSLYSLFYLANDEFFTRTSRTSLFVVTIFWQSFIVTIIYFIRHADQGDSLVLLAAFAGWLFSIPIPFLFGNAYLTKLKALKSQKYQDLVHMKFKDIDQNQKQQLQRDTITNQQNLRNLYFIYYVAIFITLALIFILCVLGMSSFTYYYFFRNEQWLISMGIIIIFDLFVFEPACTALFGQTETYKTRGYYFDGKIAELYKKAD